MADIENRYFQVPSESDSVDSQQLNNGHCFKAGIPLIGGSCVVLFSIMAISACAPTFPKTTEAESTSLVGSSPAVHFPRIAKGPGPVPPKGMGNRLGSADPIAAGPVRMGEWTSQVDGKAALLKEVEDTRMRRAVLGGLAASFGMVPLAGVHAGTDSGDFNRRGSEGMASRPVQGWLQVDWPAVKADILAVMAKDANRGPTLVRLAWHASGTYDKMTRTGGSQGGTIRFEEELAHGANAGLNKAVAWLEPVYEKHAEQGLSHADLYTLAGAVAIEAMGGPPIKWQAGRGDALSREVPPEGRLPAADKGDFKSTGDHLREVFNRMGFDDQDIVALSGAHALGYTHKENSGYEGPWTSTPTKLTNAYYIYLLKLPWEEETVKATGKRQYGTGKKPNRLMMLESDLALINDPKFRPYVEAYAKDQALFFTDFAASFSRLLELGCSGLKTVKLGAA